MLPEKKGSQTEKGCNRLFPRKTISTAGLLHILFLRNNTIGRDNDVFCSHPGGLVEKVKNQGDIFAKLTKLEGIYSQL